MSANFLRGKPKSAEALVAAIERAVGTGDLRTDERLPPVRELAEAAGLAPNTVAAAYRTLNQRGVLVGKGRAGTFVSARPPIGAPVQSSAPPGTVDVSTGSPDPALLPDLGAALARIDPTPVLYGANPVDPALAPWARAWASPPGIDAERVAIVSGALDGVERVLGAHLRPGDQVAVEDPGYAAVYDLLAAMGLVAVAVGIDHDGPRPDQLRRVLQAGAHGFVFTPRAHNPTGNTLGAARCDELAAVLADHPEVLLIEDDHAGPIAGATRRTLIAADRARWASICSVAKSLGPDLRLAFVAADRLTLDRVQGRQQLGTGWVSHLLQRLVAELLGTAETDALLARAARSYGERRNRILELLGAAGIAASGASGLNVWVPVAAETPVVGALAQRGWWVRPGERYRLASPPAVRLSVATLGDDQLDRLAGDLIEVLGHTEPARRIG